MLQPVCPNGRKAAFGAVVLFASVVALTLLAGCSLGVSAALSTNDVADIVAATIASPTGGGLSSVQNYVDPSVRAPTAQPLSSSITRAAVYPFGAATRAYLVRFTSGDWFNQVPPALADRLVLSATGSGSLVRQRLNGSFTSATNLQIQGNTVPYSASDRFDANGTTRISCALNYTNWERTETMSLIANVAFTWKDVRFLPSLQESDGNALIPANGSVAVSCVIEKGLSPDAQTGAVAWEGTLNVDFDGSANAALVFPDGEKKLINLTTGEVVQ
ncbi:MAG TPA: hypothetical protein VMW73_13030 [Spirochaetia bacterium]|nr:hypothetical protein [Spirochaetia bacterium]